MSPTRLTTLLAAAFMVCAHAPSAAADDVSFFAGGLFGVSVLSADAQAVTSGSDIAISLYEPASGPALNVFAGVHVAEYFSVQANWMWNRNDLRLVSSIASGLTARYVEQHRRSRQHAVVFDGLVYFRRRDSRVRPYLGTGLSIARFSSDASLPASGNAAAADGDSTRLGLRSHVGIDFAVAPRLAFRYSFSETISANPISPLLTPPGRRGLMNFENLFGAVLRF